MPGIGKDASMAEVNEGGIGRNRRKGAHISWLAVIAAVLAVVLAAVSIATLFQIFETDLRFEENNLDYNMCKDATTELRMASDTLTSTSRLYVTSGERRFLDEYLNEYINDNRRGKALDTLRSKTDNEQAVAELEEALTYSDELAQAELMAMRLAADAYGEQNVPAALSGIALDERWQTASPDEKLGESRRLVLGDDYDKLKQQVGSNAEESAARIIEGFYANREQNKAMLDALIVRMVILTALLLALVLFAAIITWVLCVKPLWSYVASIRAEKPLRAKGAFELRYFADAYNAMFEKNREHAADLKRMAEIDSLTGLHNRGAYDASMASQDGPFALLIFDVDHFKEFNDEYGHDMGDKVLKKVAGSLSHSFRSTDYCCRIGGDEFAVIMGGVQPNLSQVVVTRIEAVEAKLADVEDGLPQATLSIGVAFADGQTDARTVYRQADRALYAVKERGRAGFAFYEN